MSFWLVLLGLFFSFVPSAHSARVKRQLGLSHKSPCESHLIQKAPFYRIVNQQDQTVGYLLGTMHSGVPLRSLPKSIPDKLRIAHVAIFESGDYPLWFGILCRMQMRKYRGVPLSHQATYSAREGFEKWTGKKLSMCDRYHNAIAGILFNQSLRENHPRLQLYSEGNLDEELIALAKSCSVPTTFLDSHFDSLQLLKELNQVYSVERLEES